MTKPNEPKFKVGDLVLYKGLLGRVKMVYNIGSFEKNFYKVGRLSDVFEEELSRADWRDIQRITKGGAQ